MKNTDVGQTQTSPFIYIGFVYRPVFFFMLIFVQLQVTAQIGDSGTTGKRNDSTDTSGITIHQEVSFKVSPVRVYEALISSRQFSDCTKKSFDMFSASSAHIDPKVGGSFSVFDGHIFGITLELIPGQRLVQAWRVADWPAGVYSIVRFDLKAEGSGTKLIFDHIGFPEGLKNHLINGWQEHYWDALARYFQ